MKHLLKQTMRVLAVIASCQSMMVNTALAQNPIIRNQFSADPTARVFGDKVYVYPSHDIHSPIDRLKEWFCMADYHVFSSENLIDWQDHGVIVSQQSVPWVQSDSYSMWAPECVCKDSTYYFYFPASPKGGQRGFAVGVATSRRPEGPFFPESKPIDGVAGIDPTVLIDDDGQAYIFWSGMGIRGARLKPNMRELDSEPQLMEGLPDGFKEGPHAFKRGGIYYLTFPWVRTEGGTETLAYATSDSPLGPYTFRGLIMEEWADGCWTNHHSVCEYRGQWYLFYHHNEYSPSFDKRRSVCADSLFFNADGTIRQVQSTLRGVGVNNARKPIQVDRYSEASSGVSMSFLDSLHTFDGWEVTLPKKNGWLRYNNVNFDEVTSKKIKMRVRTDGKSLLTLREGNAQGKVIAQAKLAKSGEWQTVATPLLHRPAGTVNLWIDNQGAATSIDWIQFDDATQYFFSPLPQPSTPDGEGFIRRWLLQEPLNKPNRSNTVFTDSYLHEHLVLDSIGNGKWHNMESSRYNVKLFRFGEQTNGRLYGVLYWAKTEIVCDEDLADVRLAVGSNSASRWWLNGEEVLMLSGDRRMVKDDAVSPRITLKKGRNTLMGAIINGPGMSDFCVRLIDEKGNPVTNYVVTTPQED